MTSMLSGPIPAHPMYNKGNALNENVRPNPRVKPEAKEFAAHGKDGTIGRLFEVKGNAISFGASAYAKTKKAPRDYVSDNVRRMRQIQRRCKAKTKEEETRQPAPVKALWKSEKYAHVPAKVTMHMHSELNGEEQPPRPHSAGFLQAHSKSGYFPKPKPAPMSARQRPEPPVERLEGVGIRPASSMSELRAGRSSDFDFIKINGYGARHAPIRRSPSVQSLHETINKKEEAYSEYKRSVKGTVPKYLRERQDQWKREEEERIRNTPDPDMPPGHKAMPNAERLETLELLKKRQQDLMQKLAALPIRSDTLRVRSAKEDLEKKIREVDEAMKVMSQPKVFVKLDE